VPYRPIQFARIRGAWFALALTACGHPASKEECETIFRRSAEVALLAKNVTDPAEIARAVEEARAAKGQAMVDDCLGKRITDDAMRCVREAKSAEDLDRCLQ